MNGMNEWMRSRKRRLHRISFQLSNICRLSITLVYECLVTTNNQWTESHETWKIENSVKMNTRQILYLYGKYLTEEENENQKHISITRTKLNRVSPFTIHKKIHLILDSEILLCVSVLLCSIVRKNFRFADIFCHIYFSHSHPIILHRHIQLE